MMAEPFGIVSGALSVAAIFTTCVDCFNYVQLGRRFGKDYQTSLLTLNVVQLRLSRWGEAINIYNDPQLGNPNATKKEVQAAKDVLLQILLLFADTEKLSKKFKLEATRSEDLSVYSATDIDPVVMSLANKMRDLAFRRQKDASLLKVTRWALYNRQKFRELISDITTLVDGLEELFPPPAQQVERLAKQEFSEVDCKEQELSLLENASEGVDDLLYNAAMEVRKGHIYEQVTATDTSKVLDGTHML
ncbi:hypothetical protein TWF694_008096 [Orbilia ellipsospora]|uniref:Prion-inhibition and propagation HeLo domain-containing protein n=1 Tax=Orbilia ellipsospora TaxID=2528407 RepID=A0AAV9XHR3_9PEZI